MSEAPNDHPRAAGTPRWVKIFGLIALAIVVLVVVMVVAGRGGHGPGRHTPGDDGASPHNGQRASITHQQP